MSYKVLAVKWRPRRFEQLVGQQHVVQALVNSLAARRLHHAYLFTGTRGVGKTTLARILAKALNCAEGVVPEPCGVCAACVAIDEGRFVDLIEVDAASRTRVDDTRELLDNVQYAPTGGRFKVYLIDEVHMLSNHSFNALLKTLEEPPPHVKFLFATTDPQKLPVTVLSRCLQFNLKRLTKSQIEAQLQKICAAEGVATDEEGLRALARAADGSMRDALSLLDQGIAFGAGKVEGALINGMLGTIDRNHVFRMLEALSRRDGEALLRQVDELDELAPDYADVLDEMLGILQHVAVIQLVEERANEDDAAELGVLAQELTPEDTQLCYQIALQGRRDLPICRDPRMGFEMTLLRMLAFRPLGGEEPTAGDSSASGAEPRAGGARPPAAQAEPAPRPAVATGRATRALRHEPTTSDDWHALLQAADVRGAARQLADHCELQAAKDGAWKLVLAADKAHLNTQQLRSRLETALGGHLGRTVKLDIRSGETSHPTPAQVRAAGESRRLREAREAIERDPNVQAVQAAFDAVLEADSVRPADTTERG